MALFNSVLHHIAPFNDLQIFKTHVDEMPDSENKSTAWCDDSLQFING